MMEIKDLFFDKMSKKCRKNNGNQGFFYLTKVRW